MRKPERFRGSHPGDHFMKTFGRENPELGLRVEKEQDGTFFSQP